MSGKWDGSASAGEGIRGAEGVSNCLRISANLDPGGAVSDNQRYDYFIYDALGNRKAWNCLANRGWMGFLRRDNGLNQYTSWENNYPNPPLHWGSGIFYDDNSPWAGYNAFPGNGVTMADGWIVASYNGLNQPVAIGSSATWAMGNWMWFGFDPLGRCVKRVMGSNPDSGTATYFYYDSWNLIQEGPNAAYADRQYVHGARVDEVLAQITPPNNWIRYFHYDAIGNCTLQTDAGGNIVEQYEYDAFGYPYFFDGSGTNIGYSPWGNRFLFTGREYLRELKLYDYRNRMYQPELGRFMQPDPKEFGAGDYNLYRYCHNDPVNHSDPNGLGVWPPQYNEGINEFFKEQWHDFVGDTKEMLRDPTSWVGPGEIGMAAGSRGPLGRVLERMFPGFRAPFGTRVRPEGIPQNWRIRPTESQGGTEYYNPRNRNESVRVTPGNPNSPHPNSQKPYVRQRDSSGSYLDASGKRGDPNSAETHIPLDKFKFRRPND